MTYTTTNTKPRPSASTQPLLAIIEQEIQSEIERAKAEQLRREAEERARSERFLAD